MVTFVSRAEWGARPPKYTNALDLSKVTEYIVHYSGASRSQTVRSIQNYSMDTKGYSDIDYNYIVKDGLVYIGRGDSKGGHTLNHNSVSYGVCVIGEDGDATAADFTAVRDLYEYLCAHVGRPLAAQGHRDANPGQTDCPGNQIEAWIRDGMPRPGDGDDMFCKIGDTGDKVLAMQIMVVSAGFYVGPSENPYDDCDGQYGPNTSQGLSEAVGGSGDVYGPWQFTALIAKQGKPGPQGEPGPKGDKGDPGTFEGTEFIATGKFTHVV